MVVNFSNPLLGVGNGDASVTSYSKSGNVATFDGFKKAVQYQHVFCTLKDNYRKGANWLSSDTVVLDFDEGMTIDQFVEVANKLNVKCYIASSKSYDGVSNFGFHAYFPLSKTYTDAKEYHDIQLALVHNFEYSDKAVSDLTRFLFPTPALVAKDLSGNATYADELECIKEAIAEAKAKQQQKLAEQEAPKEVAPATTNTTNTSVPEVPAKRGAGRPKGSLNKKTVQSNKDEIEMMLSVINPTLKGQYEVWRSLVFAGHKEGMSEETMRNWSKGWLYAFSDHQTVPTYSDEAFDNLWNHITDESDDPNTFGTIKYYFDEAINEKLAHFPADDELTETGQAKMLVHHYKDILAYCAEVGWVWFINKNGWQINEDAPILVQEKLRVEQSIEFAKVSTYLSDAKSKELLKFMKQTQGGSFISKTTTLAKGHLVVKKGDDILKYDDAFDADFSLALCPNGKVVNLHTGKVVNVEPAHRLINKLGAIPNVSDDPEGVKLWNKILEDTFVNKDKTPNKEYIKYFQLQIGGAMLRNNPRKQFHFLVGDGGNGKTFITRVLLSAFGGFGFKFSGDDLTNSNQFTTSDLQHKMFVSVSEGSKGQKFTDGALKRFTETGTIRVERKGKQAELAYASCTYFWDTNHLPRTDDTGYATRSRQDVLPFYQQFDSTIEGNKLLEDMLTNHLSVVVQWMVDGAVMAHKLSCCFEQVKPAIVREAIAEYQFSNDPIARYFDDPDCEYEITGNLKDTVIADAIYADYLEWFNMLEENPQGIDFVRKTRNRAKSFAEQVEATYCRRNNVKLDRGKDHGTNVYIIRGIAPKGKGHKPPTGTDDDTSKGNAPTSFTKTVKAEASQMEFATAEALDKVDAKNEAKGLLTVSYADKDVADNINDADNEDTEVSVEQIHELHKQLDESEDDSFFTMPSVEQQEATVKQVEQTINKQKEMNMNNEQVAPSSDNEPHHFTSKGKQKDPNYEHEFWEAHRAEAMRKSEALADKQRVQAFSSPHFETDREHDPQYDAWCKEQGICDDLPF